MKKIVQGFLAKFGVKLVWIKNRKKLPAPTIELVELVAKFISKSGSQVTLLQVGACDGLTSDSVYSYIKAGVMKAYLVEPSQVNFGKLKSFYENYGNVTLINAAIADKDENRLFYTIKDEGRWKDNGGARQLASFYKEHILRHGVSEHEVGSETVDCLTLRTVISKFHIPDIDLLLIDTEGYDAEIVKMALNQGVRPAFLVFENGQFFRTYTQLQLDDLYSLLGQHGYVWVHDRINTLAILREWLNK